MNEQIDWSKAPEDATHKNFRRPNGLWYRFDFQKNTAEYCSPGDAVWVLSGRATDYEDGSMADLVARPGEIELRLQRTKIIDEMVRDLDVPRAIAVRAYAAGYRKQVHP